VADLNRLYRAEPSLHQLDCVAEGFAWMDCTDADHSVVAFARFARDRSRLTLCVCNFTPVPRREYRVGVPRPGFYREVLNSDSAFYGGADVGNGGGVPSEPIPWHGQPHSLRLTLPPLGAVWLAPAEA
jgi:1,4-alpha-glucan branching enzyme